MHPEGAERSGTSTQNRGTLLSTSVMASYSAEKELRLSWSAWAGEVYTGNSSSPRSLAGGRGGGKGGLRAKTKRGESRAGRERRFISFDLGGGTFGEKVGEKGGLTGIKGQILSWPFEHPRSSLENCGGIVLVQKRGSGRSFRYLVLKGRVWTVEQ